MNSFLCALLIFGFSTVYSHTHSNQHFRRQHEREGSNYQNDLINHVPGEPLSPNDFQNAEVLRKLEATSAFHTAPIHQKDPIELAGLFEGDIILGPEEFIPGPNDTRNAIIKDTQKWAGGIIPYVISAQFNPLERSVLARAFLDYQRQTCIVFRPRTTEPDFIHIMKGNGCSSHVGRTGGDQPVILGNGCVFTGITTHELMHAVGFWHEQSRWDRDEHVTVNFPNIASGMDFNFRKYSWRDIQNLSAPYDTGSILHYGSFAFSKDKNSPTIVPKIPNGKMGQRDGLSKIDIWKINKIYNCFGSAPAPEANTTQPPKGQEGKCVDSHRHCIPWAKQGECTKNPSWMLANCKKSCDSCDSPCADSNTYCKVWEQNGECSRNPQYMNTYCAKSCGTCVNDNEIMETQSPVLAVECTDDNTNCKDWAKTGECSKNPDYMLVNCRESCKFCLRDVQGPSTVEIVAATESSILVECKDKDKECGNWAESGECTRNPDYMLVTCRESCKTCFNEETEQTSRTGATGCKDQDEECGDWAKIGECDVNPGFMLVTCPVSCRTCTRVGDKEGMDIMNEISDEV